MPLTYAFLAFMALFIAFFGASAAFSASFSQSTQAWSLRQGTQDRMHISSVGDLSLAVDKMALGGIGDFAMSRPAQAQLAGALTSVSGQQGAVQRH